MRDVPARIEPYGITTFCEDIRNEVDGRHTFVGVFGSEMVVPQVPIVLPKLAINVVVVTHRVEGPISIGLDIYFPGDVQNSPTYQIPAEVDYEAVKNEPMYEDPDVPNHLKMFQQIVFSPIKIKEEGLIKIRMRVNDDYIRAGILKVVTIESKSKDK